jgi:hypothetical protein
MAIYVNVGDEIEVFQPAIPGKSEKARFIRTQVVCVVEEDGVILTRDFFAAPGPSTTQSDSSPAKSGGSFFAFSGIAVTCEFTKESFGVDWVFGSENIDLDQHLAEYEEYHANKEK